MGLFDTKIKDLPRYFTRQVVGGGVVTDVSRSFMGYAQTYLRAGKVNPVFHVIIGLGIMGYALEYPHIYESERQAKHH
eukprot:Clim_evm60s243 gene=Clim_evmTU60s243